MKEEKKRGGEPKRKGPGTRGTLQKHGPRDLLPPFGLHLLRAHGAGKSLKDESTDEVTALMIQSPLLVPLLKTAALWIKPSIQESLGDTSHLNHKISGK